MKVREDKMIRKSPIIINRVGNHIIRRFVR